MKRYIFTLFFLALLTGMATAANTFGTEPFSNPYPSPYPIDMPVIWSTAAVATGDDQGMAYVVPAKFNGYYLASPWAYVYTVSSSGTPTVQFHKNAATDMFSTLITIDANENHSKDSAAGQPVVITAGGVNLVATGDVIHFDVDVAGTGTCGLTVGWIFQVNQIALDLGKWLFAALCPMWR
jgi:curli biogenesis system outer membrane secretion channel CsgG